MPHIADATSSGRAVRTMPNTGIGWFLRELLVYSCQQVAGLKEREVI